MSTDEKTPIVEKPASWCAKLRVDLQLPALPARRQQAGAHRAQPVNPQPQVNQPQPRMQAGMHRNQPVNQQPPINQQPPVNPVLPAEDGANLASRLDDLRNDLSDLDNRIKLLADARSKAVLFRDVLRIQKLLDETQPLLATDNDGKQQKNVAENQLTQAQELIAKLESKLPEPQEQPLVEEQPPVDLEFEKTKAELRKKIDLMYKRLIRANPQNAKQLLADRQAALSSNEASELSRFFKEADAKTDLLATEGQQEANDAIKEVKQGKLEGLAVEKKIELLGKLQGGTIETLKERQIAMAKLYEVMPLQPEFSKKEKKKRGAVLNALQDDPKIGEYRDQWSKWSEMGDEGKKQKEAALKYILEAQSKLMGIQKIPEIVFITKGKETTDDSERFDQGSFGFEDRTLEINDHPDSDFSKDFDKSMVTMLHENTHNFQAELVDKLLDGTLTEKDDKEYYQQAMLFLLNQRSGYLVTPEGYETQPTERQAFEAEDEAKRRFGVDLDILDAKAQAKAFLERIDLNVKQAEKRADEFLVTTLKSCKSKLQDGMQGAKTAAEINQHYKTAKVSSDEAIQLLSNSDRLEASKQEGQMLTARIDKLLKECKSAGLAIKNWSADIDDARDSLEEVAKGDEDSLDDVANSMDAALGTWYDIEPKISDALLQAEAKT